MVVREIEVNNIITKTSLPVSDFAINPYVGCTHACKYCYASFMKRFTNHPEPWGEFVDIKNWPKINATGKYVGKEAFFCSVTDPYQPLEKKYMRTRALLEQLLDTGMNISISTKSDLIIRDLDLIKKFPSANVAWSINTLDKKFQKDMDCAVSIERRLEAMRQFYESEIQTACFISPIFPGITDVLAIIERVKAHCNFIWLENLNLRGDYKSRIFGWIHKHHPELDDLYHEIYTKKSRKYWVKLDQEIRAYSAKNGIIYIRKNEKHRPQFGKSPVICNYFYHEEIRRSAKKKNNELKL